MTEAAKLKYLSSQSGETDDEILLAFLDLAREKILHRLYPFRSQLPCDVPPRYDMTQLEIALYLLNKRGAEGETGHSENGINRSYESATVPESMLRDIVPFGSVLGG